MKLYTLIQAARMLKTYDTRVLQIASQLNLLILQKKSGNTIEHYFVDDAGIEAIGNYLSERKMRKEELREQKEKQAREVRQRKLMRAQEREFRTVEREDRLREREEKKEAKRLAEERKRSEKEFYLEAKLETKKVIPFEHMQWLGLVFNAKGYTPAQRLAVIERIERGELKVEQFMDNQF